MGMEINFTGSETVDGNIEAQENLQQEKAQLKTHSDWQRKQQGSLT
jgi:hypothetical protein